MIINEDCIRDVLGYLVKNIDYKKDMVTYEGHKFYETIQPESVWNKTKSIVGKIGNHTLGFIESVAHDVAVESAKEFVKISTGNI